MKGLKYNLTRFQKKRVLELAGVSRQTLWTWNTGRTQNPRKGLKILTAIKFVLKQDEKFESAKKNIEKEIDELIAA